MSSSSNDSAAVDVDDADVFVVPVPSSNEVSVSSSTLFWNASIRRIFDNAIAFRTYASRRVDLCLSMFLHFARKCNKKTKRYYVRIGYKYLFNSLAEHSNLGAIVYEKNVVGWDCFCRAWLRTRLQTLKLCSFKRFAGQLYMICKLQVLFEGETIEQTLWNRLHKTYKKYTN